MPYREKAIAFLQDMIAIPSVTGDEARDPEVPSEYMTKLGLTSTCGRPIGRR
jgi:acetylornithine deacetylase